MNASGLSVDISCYNDLQIALPACFLDTGLFRRIFISPDSGTTATGAPLFLPADAFEMLQVGPNPEQKDSEK
jgi:hypothetical protein